MSKTGGALGNVLNGTKTEEAHSAVAKRRAADQKRDQTSARKHRLQIRVTEDLHRKVKTRAAQDGESVDAIVRRLLEDYLTSPKRK